jgi:hypothetical protein
MRKQRDWVVCITSEIEGGESREYRKMTMREILASAKNVHRLNDGVVRQRLISGERDLDRLLRQKGVYRGPKARKGTGRTEGTVTPAPEVTLATIFTPPYDPINPAHYRTGSIEAIDAIQSALTPEEFRGYLKGSALKYLWREKHKGGDEDLRKANWYLNRLNG